MAEASAQNIFEKPSDFENDSLTSNQRYEKSETGKHTRWEYRQRPEVKAKKRAYELERYHILRNLAILILGAECLICHIKNVPFKIHHLDGSGFIHRKRKGRQRAILNDIIRNPFFARLKYALLCCPCEKKTRKFDKSLRDDLKKHSLEKEPLK